MNQSTSSKVAIGNADFDEQVLQSDYTVLVDEWAEWCALENGLPGEPRRPYVITRPSQALRDAYRHSISIATCAAASAVI